MSGHETRDILLLFDVDGTLTPHRNPMSPEVEDFILNKVKPLAVLGLVSGSDFKKTAEQMGGESILQKYDYIFSENGLVAYKDGQLLAKQSILEYIGEEKLQKFLNFSLRYMSELTLPAKRGNFVEFRSGLINLCPVGRSCSQAEREEFSAYDSVHKIREKFCDALAKEFPDLGLTFAIGGQISLDVFPIGWDKRFCLQFVENEKFKEIHFFGDSTWEGGNDHQIFADDRTIGHTVANPKDTVEQLKKLFNINY